jgi:hypothetical protein
MALAFACAAVLACGGRALASDLRVHALIIGNNLAYGSSSAVIGNALPALRFADDDAAAFYVLVSALSKDTHLLTVMDAETQELYPELPAVARPPTLSQVKAAVGELSRSIASDHAQGHSTAVFVFFSGHGSTTESGVPALALLDGNITREFLYDEILAKLPADYIHVLVDACHAEAVVRPRGTDVQTVSVTAADAEALLVRSTLARFPNVGAIVAAASDGEAHEWDRLHHGVFTYEILSALRGGADVNRDGRIEYSEVVAFLSAANRDIDNPSARMTVVARPPEVDRRVALVDMTQFRSEAVSRIAEISASAGLIDLEDQAGRRLGSVHAEKGSLADIVVPARSVIYLRTHDGEARVQTVPGDVVAFRDLTFGPSGERSRGSLDSAMRRGFFAAEFGRHYYSGFIDQAHDFVPVTFPTSDSATDASEENGAANARGISDLVFLVGATTTVVRTDELSEGARLAFRPSGPRGLVVSTELLRDAPIGGPEWQTAGYLGWLWSVGLGSMRASWGALAGGGAIEQRLAGQSARWSGLLSAGPTLGIGTQPHRGLGVWSEAQFLARAYRQENRTELSLAPGAWLGVSLGL